MKQAAPGSPTPETPGRAICLSPGCFPKSHEGVTESTAGSQNSHLRATKSAVFCFLQTELWLSDYQWINNQLFSVPLPCMSTAGAPGSDRGLSTLSPSFRDGHRCL